MVDLIVELVCDNLRKSKNEKNIITFTNFKDPITHKNIHKK